MLTRFSLGVLYLHSFVTLFVAFFCLSVATHEKMPSVSIASNVQKTDIQKVGWCAGEFGYIWSRPYRSSGKLKDEAAPTLRNFYILQKKLFSILLLGCLLALWLLSPGTQYHVTTLTKVSWPICKALCFSRQSCIFFICIHSTPTVWFSWTFVWLVISRI